MKKAYFLSSIIFFAGICTCAVVYSLYPFSEASKTAIPITAAPSENPLGNITILSEGKTRQLVLDEIATQANIIIDYSPLSTDQLKQKIHIDLINAPLESALSSVLQDIEFYSQLSFDQRNNRHYISSIFFKKPFDSTTGVNIATITNQAKDTPLPITDTYYNQEEDTPTLEVSPEERKIKKELFQYLDTETRLELLAKMSPVGMDLQHISNALLNDSDPKIRAAAAKRLSFSESYSATSSLLTALSDQDETVVIEAMNSLIKLGDASVLPLIGEKLINPSENVKASLASAKEAFNKPVGMDSDNY